VPDLMPLVAKTDIREVRLWPFSEVRQRPLSRRCWRTSGHHVRLLLAADFMSTHPSVMGPMMSSLPGERHAAELMLLSVVDAWPPHHAVRGSGEPI